MIRPHRIIGENYLSRWHVIPRNPILNVMIHKFTGSDDDRAKHCHPWFFVSFLLRGSLVEFYLDAFGRERVRRVPKFWPVFRRATWVHRLLLRQGPAWTLVITGPVIRPWYFHCTNGMVHHRDFTDASGNGIGRGCD